MADVYVNSLWTTEDAFNNDVTKPAGAVWGGNVYSNLDDLFAAGLTGDVTVHLLSDVSAVNRVNTSYSSSGPKYNFVTELSGATVTFEYEDNWNNFHQ